MSTRSGTNTVLILCILLFTIPLWIGLAGGMFGLMAGLFGGLMGIIGALFGVAIGIIMLPFRILFGWGHGPWFPGVHFHGFFFLAVIVLIAALIVRKRNR